MPTVELLGWDELFCRFATFKAASNLGHFCDGCQLSRDNHNVVAELWLEKQDILKSWYDVFSRAFPPTSSFGRNSLFQFHSVIKELTVNFVYSYRYVLGEWTRKITHFRVLFLSFWICYSTKVFYLKISEITSRIRLVYLLLGKA